MYLSLAFLLIISTLAMAQNHSINLFMPTAFYKDVKFAASVIGVAGCKTTWGVRCTSGIFGQQSTCHSDTPDFTVTEGGGSYVATKSSSFTSAFFTETETCIFQGTTEASCTAKVVISGTKVTTTSTSSILSGTTIAQFYMYEIPITAGAQYLQPAVTACSGATKNMIPFVFGSLIGTLICVVACLL